MRQSPRSCAFLFPFLFVRFVTFVVNPTAGSKREKLKCGKRRAHVHFSFSLFFSISAFLFKLLP
jgi:hypothetical protein